MKCLKVYKIRKRTKKRTNKLNELYPWARKKDNDLIITIKVKTDKPKDEIFLNSDNELIVYVSASPVKGKANKKILQLFKKRFKVISILESGHTNSIKRIRLEGIKIADFLEKIR